MRKIKTRAELRDRAGRLVHREFVHLRVRVRGLWTLAQWINFQAFGIEAYSPRTAPRIPLWANGPTVNPHLSEREKSKQIGRWVLDFQPLRLLFDLESFLKQCGQCGYWFVDLTRNHRKERCSGTCTNRWWTRKRRREVGMRRRRSSVVGGRDPKALPTAIRPRRRHL